MPTQQTENHLYPCPCCGFLVFEEPPGSYDICGVCGWEDDHVQLQFPFMRGGANGQSLYECQLDILREIPEHIDEYEELRRDKGWRPLHAQDIHAGQEAPTDGIGYFQSAVCTEPQYYWERVHEGGVGG